MASMIAMRDSDDISLNRDREQTDPDMYQNQVGIEEENVNKFTFQGC